MPSSYAQGTLLHNICPQGGYAPGYASGKIPKISNFLKYSPRLSPQAMPQGK
ncbi:hypothetical protein T01_1773 [Trichinella spiralis]|uniref:Uncharacterized protein n=1 Tax=Trichinella spiralis TaxID=6334 RepID=A0A0V0YY28_TRISP|nr:hypothetical protein T01_1773 [Trichinella spiralis]